MTIGEQFLNARKACRLSLREVQRRVGISVGYLSLIETGRRPNPPSSELLWRLCVLYGLCPCDVLRTAYGEETSE